MIVFEQKPNKGDNFAIPLKVEVDSENFEEIMFAFKAFLVGITFHPETVSYNIPDQEELEELRMKARNISE